MILKSERGAAAMILALIGVAFSSAIIGLLPSKVIEYAKENRQLSAMIVTSKVAESIAVIILDARNKGSVACGANESTINLPGSNTPLCIPDNDICFNMPFNAKNDFLPKSIQSESKVESIAQLLLFSQRAEAATTSTVTATSSPVILPSLSTGLGATRKVCLDKPSLTASLDSKSQTPAFSVKIKRSWSEVAYHKTMNELLHVYQNVQPHIEFLPSAVAQLTFLPPEPTGIIGQTVDVPACSAASPKNNPHCEACAQTNAECVRLKIEDPALGVTFNQRIIIYTGT